MHALRFRFAILSAAFFLTACGRTAAICETAVDCERGQVCSVAGCVPAPDGGSGGGGGGGALGGGAGGGGGGGLGGGLGGGGPAGGGSPNCRSGETECPGGCKNLNLDLDNCGRCGRPCPEGANATATCSGGTCGLQCAPGFADCDLNPMNGCEANFSTPATCGACRNLCPSGPNASATCSMGVCALSCRPGFGNCDFSPTNGCEADLSSPGNCGTCGNLCRTGANQVPTCVLGSCGTQCRPGFGDCDMLASSGCEANLSSPATCGSCSNACPSGGPNTMALCSGTSCSSGCRPGFADCDSMRINGCEASLNVPATCGSCTNACPTGQPCTNGTCGAGGCPAPAVGVLAPNTTVMGTLPLGTGRFPLPTCSPESPGFDQLWTFALATVSSVVFETGGNLDTVLMLRSNCSTGVDLGCNDDTPGIGTRSRIIATLQPGTYSVLVKEWGANPVGGAYSLSATIGSASNATCTSATLLFSGVTLRSQDSANGGAPSAACIPAAGGQLFYRVDLGPNERASIAMTPTSMASMTMRLLSSCTATSCISFVQGATPQALTFDNRTSGAQTVIVSVSSNGVNGFFDIVADIGPIPTGMNITCSSPTPLLVNGMPITGEAIDLGGPPFPSCMPAQAGRVRYYSVAVPPRGSVTVSGSLNTFNLGLRVLSSCGTASCAAFADGSAGTGPESVRITNPASVAQTYIVAVSSASVGTGGTYSISAVTSNPAPAPNAFCDAPTGLPPSIAIAGEFALIGGLPLTNLCLSSQSGYVRYYSVVVPPTTTLQAVATPGAVNGVDVGLRLFTGCTPSACTAAADATTSTSSLSGGEGVVLSNLTSMPQVFTLAVSAVNTWAPATGQFSVVAILSPASSNAFCASAQAMTVGQTLPSEFLAGGGPSTTSCLPDGTGLSKYYRVNVAAGDRINVVGTPLNFDLSLRAMDGCIGGTCVASADASPSNNAAERISIQNDTVLPRDYVIAVSGPGATTAGAFSLSVVRSAYSMRPLTASCDDLSSAPDLLGQTTTPPIADDAVTPVLPLPPGFAFSFFQTPMSHYSVAMNGFAQLYTSAAGVPSNSFANTALPSLSQPNNLLAPLWDDLVPITGQTHVRSAARGAAPNRVFTLQWFDAAFLTGGVGPERLRFQVKLFETTGVIEFHYCDLQLNGGSIANLTGATSTIGLENGLGTDAVQRSFNTANSISSGSGLRFVPQ